MRGRYGQRRELIPGRCGELPTCSLLFIPPQRPPHPPDSSLPRTSPPARKCLTFCSLLPVAGYLFLLCLVPLSKGPHRNYVASHLPFNRWDGALGSLHVLYLLELFHYSFRGFLSFSFRLLSAPCPLACIISRLFINQAILLHVFYVIAVLLLKGVFYTRLWGVARLFTTGNMRN